MPHPERSRGNTPPVAPQQDLLASVFEERAEYLSRAELDQWTAQAPRDQHILSKLRGPGAKLLIGPRGSGKSTFLRRAYYELIDAGQTLTAYVNYAKSLALEPLFHRNANALQLFRQWVLLKIVVGIDDMLAEQATNVESLRGMAIEARIFIHALETGLEPPPSSYLLAPSQLLRLLERWTLELSYRRCVLLLDDAAHAFSTVQQQEFFEIFRELRSRLVAPKAAVYPGITTYSPHFSIGHEAEQVEAWFLPEHSDYIPTMREIVQRRLPIVLKRRLEGHEDLVDYLAMASFGIPRGFLVMLSQLLGVEEDESAKPGRLLAIEAVANHARVVRGIFTATAAKLPRFKHFVDAGSDLEVEALYALQSYNSGQALNRKAVSVAVALPVPPAVDRVLSLLEYAGILRRGDTISRGEKGVFQRFTVHYALILSENALSLGRSFRVSDATLALARRTSHAFVRRSIGNLLGDDYLANLTLELPPCDNCGADRISEDARFCMRCGKPLKDASIYEELLRAPLERLPLTPSKLEGITQHTSLRTVQDVILDDDGKALRSVPYIGPVWSGRIRRYAQEFVSV